MSGTLMALVIAGSALTIVGIALFVFRGALELKQERALSLGEADAHLMAGQEAVQRRSVKAGTLLKYVSIAWLVVGLVLSVVWVAEGLSLI